MDTENTIQRPTGLRMPTKFSASTSSYGLSEITDSQTNMRAQGAMMPHSTANGVKRSLHPAAQPEPKRKTLQEMAGTDFPASRSKLAAPTPAKSMSNLQPTSLKDIMNKQPAITAGGQQQRQISYTSISSRTTSNSSYAASLGPGSRPPARTHARSGSVRSTIPKNARPQTAMALRAEEPGNNSNAWDVDERLGNFESEFKAMKDMINNSLNGQKSLEEDLAEFRSKASQFDQMRHALESKKSELQVELDNAERKIFALERQLDDEQRARRNAEDDIRREHRHEIDNRLREFSREKDEIERQTRRRIEAVREEMAADFAKQLAEAHKAFAELEKLLKEEKQNSAALTTASGKNLEAHLTQLEETKRELERAKRAQDDLNALLLRREARISDLENQVTAGQTALIHLKGNEQEQLQNFRIMSEQKQAALDQAAAAMREAQEAKAKLRVEETRRRKLFEQLQTLKGNIRVMCRIRPGRNETALAQIDTEMGDYDDHIGKMTVMVPKSNNYLHQEIVEPRPYNFERVFEQHEDNRVVFEEISQLVQSALDGQKVCIFCYGQTGSGKTYTMSSGEGAIIPSATKMIYEQAKSMEDAGWTYKMYGSFTEVYNEKLYDLLGKDGTRNQVDFRQDPATNKYCIDSEVMLLESPEEVARMLETANRNRSVAATKMNRESSRSHSVFTLKLSGVDIDGNTSEGILNLIDLAGSERVKESQVEGVNFKEAASINKSLSTLSQVMTALAEGANHIPYRNSSLTKLLENCLGGNCKTLMFVMISPLRDDLKETISSLDFATTVSKAKPGQSGGASKPAKSHGHRSSVTKRR